MGSKTSYTPADLMCSEVLPPLHRAVSVIATGPSYSQSAGETCNRLTIIKHILPPLVLSIHTITNVLLSSVDLSLANCNLPAVVRGVFSEGPRVYRAVCELKENIISCSLPSNGASTECSRGAIEGMMVETECAKLHAAFTYMCVSAHTHTHATPYFPLII